jgi:zinc protease
MKQAIKRVILGWAVGAATSALVTAHLRAAEPIPPASLASPAPATLALPAAKALPFPQEGSDLKPEPAARFGTLANGLRYVVLPNHEPKGRVSMRLLVLAGSLEEKDDQRGLAHFLEHMAFNGSTHYAPGTLLEFFQRMGMSFGGDTNATTFQDHTVYILELPHADDATLAEGLRVFGDFEGGLLLRDDEINKTRGIIMSEKRARDSVSYRTFVAEMDARLGTTLLPNRLPIGLPEIISGSTRDRFVDFWNTWYRPEKMAVVVVGDFHDAAAVEKMVTVAFAGVTARAPARPDPPMGELAKFDGVRAVFHAEPESPATVVSITSIMPYPREQDSAVLRLRRLPRELAIAMLNRRLSILAEKENAPFIAAFVNVSEQYRFMREASVRVSCKPEQWADALAVGEQELRRALDHGFTATELKEVAANFSNWLEQAVKTASTRYSSGLAEEITQSLLDEKVFTSPADDLALYKPALDKLTPAGCLEALRSAFAADGRFVIVSGNAKIAGDAPSVIAAAYDASRAVTVTAPDTSKESDWGYTDFGTPGKVVKREHIADLDIELVRFANGVRLNLKKTDFAAGRIGVSARIGNGTITEPPSQRGLAALAGATFVAGGLGKHSFDDLQRILAGKNVGLQFRPEFEAFGFSGDTTRDDLVLELQCLAAAITDPGYRPEALRQARKGLEQLYLSFEHTADGPLLTDVLNLLAGGDPRFGWPSKEVMLARNLDEVKTWVSPQFEKGALEVALVGDLDIETVIGAAAQTVGALSSREQKPELGDLKKVTFPAHPFAKDYTIASAIPKCALNLFWPTTDGLDISRQRRLSMLADVLNDRLRVKVREEIGGTYTPSVESSASETFPGYGYLWANVDVDPAMADKISEVAISVADDLATNGVTEDELKRAREPAITGIRQSLRSNSYWLNSVLARAQEKPEMLDRARTRLADWEAITTAELGALAKEYLGRTGVSRATVLPIGAPVAEKKESPKAK